MADTAATKEEMTFTVKTTIKIWMGKIRCSRTRSYETTWTIDSYKEKLRDYIMGSNLKAYKEMGRDFEKDLTKADTPQKLIVIRKRIDKIMKVTNKYEIVEA